jgi:hypothetical protein
MMRVARQATKPLAASPQDAHLEQRHPDVEAVARLAEVCGAGVLVDLHGDLRGGWGGQVGGGSVERSVQPNAGTQYHSAHAHTRTPTPRPRAAAGA